MWPKLWFQRTAEVQLYAKSDKACVCSQWWSLVKTLLCQIKIQSCPALPAALWHWLQWDDKAVTVSHSESQTSSNSKIENEWSRNTEITLRLSSFHQNQPQMHRRKKMHYQKSQFFLLWKNFGFSLRQVAALGPQPLGVLVPFTLEPPCR